MVSGDTAGFFIESAIEKLTEIVLNAILPVNLEALEKNHIQQVLLFAETYEIAADMLGINMSTLWRKRKQYGL